MTPNPEQWTKLQELFHLAAATPAAERERVLGEACSDEALRRSALQILAASSVPPQPPKAGPSLSDFGPFRLIRNLGSGGTGTVYLAERTLGTGLQLCAVKVLAPHASGPDFIVRFEREQRILASLDHPYIAHMLDAGTTGEGQSWLAMEYVDGTPVDQFCDHNRLAVSARIDLFRKICEAVDYAHRNLLVHLDLKPSNILVTPEGSPKLLDFGTSKFIQPDGNFTATLMATPAYASPEQLRHEPLTTASDIYSLGVVLAELLTGRRPSGEASPAVLMERAVSGAEPEPIERLVDPPAAERRSTNEQRLRVALAGDLSNIVRKCLAPRPEDRYVSVLALSEDLERYLGGLPVLARRQTQVYRLGKFVRRNRGKVTVTALLAIALAATVAWAWREQRQAIEEGQRAIRMQTFMFRLFQTANSNITGKPAATVQEFLRMGVKVLPQYIRDPRDLLQARLGLGESMFQNRDFTAAQPVFDEILRDARASGDLAAEAEASIYAGSIAFQRGKPDEGLALCARAVELASRPGTPPRILALAAITSATNRADRGLQREPETLRLAELAVKVSRDNRLAPHETAQALVKLGEIQQNIGFLDKAKPLYEEALRQYKRDPLALCDEGDVYYGLAGVTRMSGKLAEAVPLYREALRVYETCSGAEDPETLRMGVNYAGALADNGRAPEAIALLEAALPVWQRVFPPAAPPWREYRHFLALAYLQARRYPEAERVEREDLASLAKWVKDPADRIVGYAHYQLARALHGEGLDVEALTHAATAEKILAPTTVSPGAKNLLSDVRDLIASLQSKRGP